MNNFVMHEMHCRRHIVLCDNCKEPVPRSELEKHFNELHAKVTCTVCGDPVEKDQLEHHMVSELFVFHSHTVRCSPVILVRCSPVILHSAEVWLV